MTDIIFQVTRADIESTVGRPITDDEVDRLRKCMEFSSVDECIEGAIGQVLGYDRIEWEERHWQGPQDYVAPNGCGKYLYAELDDTDPVLAAFVWHDDEQDTWMAEVREKREIQYGGTPEFVEEVENRDAGKKRVWDFMTIVAAGQR